MEEKINNKKQSVLLGGLVSTAGIFISKFLGLIYVVPFDAILQTSANKAYYSQTYNIYSYIIQIASAGLPFAIATLIARYCAREDYKTCLLVKKISFYTMAVFGFVVGTLMILFSGMLAANVCPSDGDVEIMKNSIILISLSLYIIPVLSSIRGFYQGLKELEITSMSQVIEQIVRIVFLLGMGAIVVFIFKKDAVWAVYFSVIAASIAGILTVYYLNSSGKSKYTEIKKLASSQQFDTEIDGKSIFKELITLSIPWLLIAIFGGCDPIINQMDLGPGLEAYGKLAYDNNLSTAIFMHATKIIAIPMVLATGFGTAIIPYLTSAMEKKDHKLVSKYIVDSVESVIYIALPLCFLLFLYAKSSIFVMFGASNLELDTYVLKWYVIEGFCSTITPIFTSIVMAIGCRNKAIVNAIIYAFTKLLSTRVLISIFGLGGLILSTVLSTVVVITLNIRVIQENYDVNWIYTGRKILFMMIGLVACFIVYIPFQWIGWTNYIDGRIVCLFMLGIMGCSSLFGYLAITAFLQVPQTIFNVSVNGIITKVKGMIRR